MADVLNVINNVQEVLKKGELAKFTIHSWDKVSLDENGNIIRPTDVMTASFHFEAYINPDEFTINYKVQQDNKQPLGSIGSVGTFLSVYPIELSVKFYLDGTNVTGRALNFSDPKQKTKTVAAKINEFYQCIGYDKKGHSTKFLMLHWGNLSLLRNEPDVLYCTLQSASIQYKMFNNDGTPLRAIINATFIEVGDYVKLDKNANNQSADLTHVRTIKEGDTLPGMANEVYGNFKYYLEVAKANKLKNFRNLQAGQQLIFPPLDKNIKA